MGVVCDVCGSEIKVENPIDERLHRISLIKITKTTDENGNEVVSKEVVTFYLCDECQNKIVNLIESKSL